MNFNRLGLAVLMTCSFSAMAKVSIQEKENRVQFIEKIGNAAPSLSVDAYKRELNYEILNLPLEERAKNEARLLAEKIQNQISIVYKIALKEHGDEAQAAAEIKQAIAKDLELAAPEFKKELLALATKTLRDIQSGGISNTSNLSNLEKSILPNVAERSRYLNESSMDALLGDTNEDTSKDANRLEYANGKELLDSLVSDRDSARCASSANMTLNSAEMTTTEANVSYQVKIDFLGVSLEAGPSITFKREYATTANVSAEELSPILLPDGNFDSFKRDRKGKLILKKGKPQRRFMAFTCNVSLKFATEYKGAGGFKVAGIGASAAVTQTYSNLVTMTSRNVLIPDYVGRKTMTLEALSTLCHREFLNAKITDSLTVDQSMNVMMKNVVSGLRFSHPKTKCAVDTHCIDWFNNEVVTIWKYGTYPRCFEEPREKFRACELRGLEGMACPVFKNGKMVSSGSWEVECDKNLKCVQHQAAGWNKFAKGKCQPINPNTYRDPKKYPEYQTVNDLIEVEMN
ncbi:MAG TPA: hypothetical protein VNJ08_12730 [Bacteriovoracaceae bacterium]|nr:hypothetical protein [Bacteriovoracaceae bacterium]